MTDRNRARDDDASARALDPGEAVFQNIVSTMADGIVIVDGSGIVRFANPAAEQLLGRGAGELLGAEFGVPLAVEATEIDILNGGTPIMAELRVADTVWAGEPARIASLRDVTERRRAEEDARTLIREQAARVQAEAGERRARFLAEAASLLATSLDYDQTLRSLAELIVPPLAEWCIVDILEEDGQFRRVAVAHAEPKQRALAKRIAATQPALDARTGVAAVLRHGDARILTDSGAALRAGIGVPGQEDAKGPGISIGSAIIAPLLSRGRPIGALTLIRGDARTAYLPADLGLASEVAGRAAVAVDNARLYQKAQAASIAKSEFLAIMSHELRTPLNAVIGYGDLLLLGVPAELPEECRPHVERIRTSAQHLLSLIEEILTYSRVEAGREEVRAESFDPAEIIAEALDLIRPLAENKGLTLECPPIEQLPRMESDAGKVRQILTNLLSNAVKFTDEGQVCLSANANDTNIEFLVEDSGWGIEPEHLDSIFQPFWQAERSRTRRAEGTGLGLTVALRLAQLLGGSITVNSRPGEGSRLSVQLPLRAPGAEPPGSRPGHPT